MGRSFLEGCGCCIIADRHDIGWPHLVAAALACQSPVLEDWLAWPVAVSTAATAASAGNWQELPVNRGCKMEFAGSPAHLLPVVSLDWL